ncbi:hypothetical protein LCGC14_1518800 [marine sediment metagenome]|uniref:Uncharacterized protein n=1 Tax=marine sediment metagenome TaxID=412755 RepID=A0A0F9M0B8_9ZZZZ
MIVNQPDDQGQIDDAKTSLIKLFKKLIFLDGQILNCKTVEDCKKLWQKAQFIASYNMEQSNDTIVSERVMNIAKILGPEQMDAVENGSLPIMDMADFSKHPELLAPEEINWLSPWFGIKDKCTLPFTREKMGKSTILTADAIQAARNGNKVLWVSAEEFEGEIARRVIKYSPLPPADSFNIVVDWPTSRNQLEDLILRSEADVIVIDSLTSLISSMGERVPKTSDFVAWQKLVLYFKKLAKHYGIALILIHHANKNGEFIGSVGIGQATDAIIPLHRIRKHIYKTGKGGRDIIDKDAEAAAIADGEDIFTNTTRVKYGKLRMDTNRADVYLEYNPVTGEVTEQHNYSFASNGPEYFIAQVLMGGPKTKTEILSLAKQAGMKLYGPVFYKVKTTLKIADIEKGGKYVASQDCLDLVKRFNNEDTEGDKEDF